MINKDNKEDNIPESTEEETGYIDTAYIDLQCHLIIKDVDSDDILVNKRG